MKLKINYQELVEEITCPEDFVVNTREELFKELLNNIEYKKPNDFYIGGLCAIQVACLLGLCYYSYITYKNPSFFEHE